MRKSGYMIGKIANITAMYWKLWNIYIFKCKAYFHYKTKKGGKNECYSLSFILGSIKEDYFMVPCLPGTCKSEEQNKVTKVCETWLKDKNRIQWKNLFIKAKFQLGLKEKRKSRQYRHSTWERKEMGMVHDGDLNVYLIKFFNILGFKTFLNNGKVFINIKKISLHKCYKKKSLNQICKVNGKRLDISALMSRTRQGCL